MDFPAHEKNSKLWCMKQKESLIITIDFRDGVLVYYRSKEIWKIQEFLSQVRKLLASLK
jgi:hypothetical protein